jgi:hypothetical protein
VVTCRREEGDEVNEGRRGEEGRRGVIASPLRVLVLSGSLFSPFFFMLNRPQWFLEKRNVNY